VTYRHRVAGPERAWDRGPQGQGVAVAIDDEGVSERQRR